VAPNLRPQVDRFINVKQLCELTGIGRSLAYELIASDPAFPKPRKLSERRIGWRLSEVLAWIESRDLAA
jgi:predicted DNA-binding transcriptional regulator AlpA